MPKTIDTVNQTSDAAITSPATAAPDGHAVLEQIHAVMHLVRARQYRAAADGPGELSHMDGKVLAFFARQPGATQSELAAASGRDKGQVARLVAGLRERGLLDAQPDAHDRRSVRIRLSAQGQAVHDELHERWHALAEAATRGLSDDQRSELMGLLERVRANLGSDA
ncbi:MAG: Transcriptional regulator HosA [Pseudomonadota bacterium]